MRQCKSVQACSTWLSRYYGEDEQARAWLTCIETMFSHFKQVKLLGNDVTLVGFGLHHTAWPCCRRASTKRA
jgi:hypothetical protein